MVTCGIVNLLEQKPGFCHQSELLGRRLPLLTVVEEVDIQVAAAYMAVAAVDMAVAGMDVAAVDIAVAVDTLVAVGHQADRVEEGCSQEQSKEEVDLILQHNMK